MSRLLWFVLGGVATAIGAGIAAVMLEGEAEGETFDDAEGGQEERHITCDETIMLMLWLLWLV